MVAVAMEVVGTDLIANGAQPVACLVWPVVHAERPGRRYEATVSHHPMIPIPLSMHIIYSSSFEQKLTCGLAFPSPV